jgi:hypothetical protein
VKEFFDSRLRAFSFWLFYAAFLSEKKELKKKYPTAELDNSRELQGYNTISQQTEIIYFSAVCTR